MTLKICVITGSRAEYGLLRWLMHSIREDPDLTLQVIATGMHLSPEYGFTFTEIEKDGFPINVKIEMLLSSDTYVGVSKSIGVGLVGFVDALTNLAPDIVVILGDRFEIFAAVQAAMNLRIPIAHISGGELTEGVIDERYRHAITKMSDLHFVSNRDHEKRVIQMGEPPSKVFNVGNPGLDNFTNLKLLNKDELEKTLNFNLAKTNFLVTFHPLNTSSQNSCMDTQELVRALNQFPDAHIIITKPNADAGRDGISNIFDRYSQANSNRVFVSSSLGQLTYLSALNVCDVVIGNSSSGIVEAPVVKKPTVNIGNRQSGRLKSKSIIDCEPNWNSISTAITLALSQDFKKILKETTSLYGKPGASEKIKNTLKNYKIEKNGNKIFHDIEYSID